MVDPYIMTRPFLGRLYFNNALHYIQNGNLANARESFTKARAFLSKDAASQRSLIDTTIYFAMKLPTPRRESFIHQIADEYEQHSNGWAKQLRSQFHFAVAYEFLSADRRAARVHALQAILIRPRLALDKRLLGIIRQSFKSRLTDGIPTNRSESISDEIRNAIQSKLHTSIENIERIGSGGYSGSPIYRVSIDGQSAILRLGGEQGLGECIPALRKAHVLGLPVPKIISCDETASRWMLEEYLPGRSLDFNSMMREAAIHSLEDLGLQLGRLHQVSTTGFGPILDNSLATKFLTLEEWLENQFGALYVHVQRGRLTESAFDALDRAAQLLRSSFVTPRLCHGDLIGNVLVDDDRISGIIDWGMAMGGDPAFDVASVKFMIDSSARSSVERREMFEAFLGSYGEADSDFVRRVVAHELLYAAFLSGLDLRDEDRALSAAWRKCFESLLRQK
jgi:aminoglycoside phosphotransferase (APT) family kinase protein